MKRGGQLGNKLKQGIIKIKRKNKAKLPRGSQFGQVRHLGPPKPWAEPRPLVLKFFEPTIEPNCPRTGRFGSACLVLTQICSSLITRKVGKRLLLTAFQLVACSKIGKEVTRATSEV